MTRRALALTVLSLLLVAFATGSLATQYQIIDLGTLGGSHTETRGINKLGQVAGWSYLSGNSVNSAFSWQNGAIHDLGVNPGGTYSAAYGINDSGKIVGQSGSVPHYYACTWQGTSITLLPTLAYYTHGQAMGVNNSGVVVGKCYSSGVSTACVWSGGTVTALQGLGGNSGIAWSVNSTGQIAGVVTNHSEFYHACLWHNGTPTDLGAGYAYDINDLGQVVGLSIAEGGGIWQGTSFTALCGLDSDYKYSGPVAINDHGVVAGYARYYTGSANLTKACVWQSGVISELPTLPSWKVGYTGASGANDNGDIIGYAYDSTNVYHAILWQVVPEPATVLLLVCGIGALGSAMLRKRR